MKLISFKRKSQFDLVFNSGVKLVTHHVVVLIRPIPTKTSDASQMIDFGLIVSKKVGNAVVRNLVKRRLRELMRNFLLPQYIEKAPDFFSEVVLIARHTSAKAEFESIKKSLNYAFKHLVKNRENN